jgi:hypothetical protein
VNPSTISVDLANSGHNDGFFVSFWFRSLRNVFLSETLLLTSQSVNVSITVVLGDVVFKAVFVQNDMKNTATILLNESSGSWCRLTVGFSGSLTYMRVFKFDVVDMADRAPSVAPTSSSVLPSTTMVVGGTFDPQQLEFKDLVLFWPRNSTLMTTAAFDEMLAREYNPTPRTLLTTDLSFGPTILSSSAGIGTTLHATEMSKSVDSFDAATTDRSASAGSSVVSMPIVTSVESFSAPLSSSSSSASENSILNTTAGASLSAISQSPTIDGPLIGGIVGGLALIVIGSLVIWYFRRRAPAQSPASEYGVAAVRSSNEWSKQSEYSDVADVRGRYNEYASKLM